MEKGKKKGELAKQPIIIRYYKMVLTRLPEAVWKGADLETAIRIFFVFLLVLAGGFLLGQIQHPWIKIAQEQVFGFGIYFLAALAYALIYSILWLPSIIVNELGGFDDGIEIKEYRGGQNDVPGEFVGLEVFRQGSTITNVYASLTSLVYEVKKDGEIVEDARNPSQKRVAWHPRTIMSKEGYIKIEKGNQAMLGLAVLVKNNLYLHLFPELYKLVTGGLVSYKIGVQIGWQVDGKDVPPIHKEYRIHFGGKGSLHLEEIGGE